MLPFISLKKIHGIRRVLKTLLLQHRAQWRGKDEKSWREGGSKLEKSRKTNLERMGTHSTVDAENKIGTSTAVDMVVFAD